MYVAIERKPENGCEIQTACCGESGIMLRLKLVKTAEEENAHVREDDQGIPHGTKVLKELVFPWANTNRIVCADSYFASVTTAEEMTKMGLRFIGTVKTATRKFPMDALQRVEFTSRGQHKGMLHYDVNGKADMLAFTWVDRERRCFIATAGSLQEGKPYKRMRWHQLEEGKELE